MRFSKLAYLDNKNRNANKSRFLIKDKAGTQKMGSIKMNTSGGQIYVPKPNLVCNYFY